MTFKYFWESNLCRYTFYSSYSNINVNFFFFHRTVCKASLSLYCYSTWGNGRKFYFLLSFIARVVECFDILISEVLVFLRRRAPRCSSQVLQRPLTLQLRSRGNGNHTAQRCATLHVCYWQEVYTRVSMGRHSVSDL